ncbi:MAG: slipin family protein [Candidatus Hydrothermarchaeales archaeon]
MPVGTYITIITILVVLVVSVLLKMSIWVFKEYERGVLFRMGRLQDARGPGLVFIIPFVDKIFRVDLRVVTENVSAQDVITKDNVTTKVDAVIYFNVMDAVKSTVEVADYVASTTLISQTTLRGVIGQHELDELLAERDKINYTLQRIIDSHTEPWGVKVSCVEVKDVELPEVMKRAMARQAEAERERRAKVINALGEFQAAEKLAEAAEIIGPHPMALQLRYLQSLVEISGERGSNVIFPVPIDLFKPFLEVFEAYKSKKKD